MDETLEISGARHASCSELRLRRLRAGELDPLAQADLQAHVAACGRCRATLAGLEQEERAFRSEVSFDAFAERVQSKKRALARLRWAGPVSLALAAGLTAVILVAPLRAILQGDGRGARLKGGAELALFVGGNGEPARPAAEAQTLAPGERVRIGYRAGEAHYLLVLSIDEAGEVTPLYPEDGESQPVDRTPGMHLMPDSLELTGRGLERVVALFSARPLSVDEARDAATEAWKRAGGVERMGRLDVPAEQSSRLLRKP